MTPQAPDYGHRETDRELLALSRRLHLSYRQAKLDLEEKITKYLEQFEREDAEKRALYDSGEMSHEAFIKWRQKMISDTKAWRDMLNQLADDMTHQNQIAASMIDDTLPDVYALNHNYGTFEAEKGSGYDTTYTLYDKSTVKRLLTEHEDLLPHPSVPIEKDKLWNKQHLQSALLQGILTGEPMGDIAKRFQTVTDMTERAAMRNARTAVTGAENAGRIDSYIRAQNMGIKMKQMWMATLDARTRDSHAIMDGQIIEVGKKFSNGCSYPGDPQGAPAECYNCRCTLVAIVEGADPYNPNLRPSEYLKEEGLTYERWKEMHGERFYSKLFKDVQEGTYKSRYSTIGINKPIRPRKSDFDSDDDFYDARELYKQQREKYEHELESVIEQASSVQRFNNKDEIIAWAQKNGIIIEDSVWDNVDIKTFNETSFALDEMFTKFSEIKSFKFENEDGSLFETKFRIGIDKNCLLSANGGLNFGRDFKRYEDGLREAFEQQIIGDIVKGDGTFSSLVRHEYGHNVKSYIEIKMRDEYHLGVLDWRINYNSLEEYRNAQDEYRKEKTRFDKELLSLAGLQGSSGYSNFNEEELFAEGFSAYTSGEKTEFAIKFGEFLKRWY